MRGLHFAVPEAGEVAGAKVVGQDEHDVRPGRWCAPGGGDDGERKQQRAHGKNPVGRHPGGFEAGRVFDF